jgi:hypothetical protein
MFLFAQNNNGGCAGCSFDRGSRAPSRGQTWMICSPQSAVRPRREMDCPLWTATASFPAARNIDECSGAAGPPEPLIPEFI